MITFVLPWPEACLSQNSRGHWAVSAPRKKKARVVAKRITTAALKKGPPMLKDGILVRLLFHPPLLKRRRDLQNLIGAMKYAVDGIADAINVDDSEFGLSFGWGEAIGEGLVAVTLTNGAYNAEQIPEASKDDARSSAQSAIRKKGRYSAERRARL